MAEKKVYSFIKFAVSVVHTLLPSRNYSNLIEKLNRIPHLRYASIADEMGQRVVGGMKPGVKSATAPEEEARLSIQSILSLRTAESYQKFTGKLQYLCINWERMYAVFFLLPNSQSLTITVDRRGDQSEVVRKAMRAIKSTFKS